MNFAIVDIETTWATDVMSIGVVIAHAKTLNLITKRYYIITPSKDHGGMYTSALYINNTLPDLESSRLLVIRDLTRLLYSYNITSIFAYNAIFDYGHLPEIAYLDWYDIMQIAAYRQHNPKIPADAECFSTGRLKRGYGVETMYRLLSGNYSYCETHNALLDAIDELEIIRMLGHPIDKYEVGKAWVTTPPSEYDN